MDSVTFTCPCGQKIEAPPEMRGQQCQCPSCNETVIVPKGSVWRRSLLWVAPLVALAVLLQFDYEFWESKGHNYFEDTGRGILVAGLVGWACLAFACTPKSERGRFLAVLGCGVMVVGWWGFYSVPFVIVGAVILLFGLADLIVTAMKDSKK